MLSGASDRIWHRPGVFQLQRCRCGLVATRPRPTAEALPAYYDHTYSGTGRHSARIERAQKNDAMYALQHRQRLAALLAARPLQPGDRLLDVGCSYGGFLRYARRRTGCDATGIDVDADALTAALDRTDIRYIATDLESFDAPEGSFAAVVFLESLEHLPDPAGALRAARRLIADDGVCVVEVPNYDGWMRRLFKTAWLPLLVPQHLYHFTPATLSAALDEAGFQVVSHRNLFWPGETMFSLGIWTAAALRIPPPGSPFTWRTPFDITVFVVLLVMLLTLELPIHLALWALGKTGHQIAVARPAAE